MNNNTQPKFYFSAYPLKFTGETAETSLKVSKPINSDGVLKILPVSNSRSKKFTINALPETNVIQNMENHDVGWYNNYE